MRALLVPMAACGVLWAGGTARAAPLHGEPATAKRKEGAPAQRAAPTERPRASSPVRPPLMLQALPRTPPESAPPVAVDRAFQLDGVELAQVTLEAFRSHYGPAPISTSSGFRYVCYRMPRGPFVVFGVSHVGAGLQLAWRLSDVDWRFGEPDDPVRPAARCHTTRRVSALLEKLRVDLKTTPRELSAVFDQPLTSQGDHLHYQWWDRFGDAQHPRERGRFVHARWRASRLLALQLYETLTE